MPKRPIRAEDLLRFQLVSDPQISPDGSKILFAKKQVGEKNNYVTNLYQVDFEGNVQQWSSGGKDSLGRWSPDGKWIAFVSSREKPFSQIYLLSAGGGEAKKLSNLPEGSIGEIRWSPDNKWIAFSFRETHPDRTEKAKKEREEKGLSAPPWEIDNIWYRLDGDGYFGAQRHAIYLLDVATGEHRKLYDACVLGWYSFDWSPNSQELVVAHPFGKTPLLEPENYQIFRVNLEGQVWQLEGLPKGGKDAIRWSPCGKWLAYLGDVDENDPWGVRNTRLYVVSAEGGEAKCITPEDDFCLAAMTLSDTKDAAAGSWLEWSPDGQALYVAVATTGEGQIGFVQVEKAKVELLTQGKHLITPGSLSRDGERIACLYGHPTQLNEVGLFDLTKSCEVPCVLTKFNQAFHDEVNLVEPEEIWLDSTDGVKVQTWSLKPLGYMEPNRYPAILEIHGGPHAQYGWTFFHEFQLLAAQGYAVVYSNPRGSKGYGEAFCAAIRGDWGNKDWEDIQTVTRWMQHQPFIHPGQMGVMGGSYGGYMTNWVVGHTQDFKAAITDRCVSNLVSMSGSSDFVAQRDQYWRGHAWGDLEAIHHLWACSPLSYFGNVKTPMLIIHSEGDLRCNIEQGEQVFSALQIQGIESRFVRYPSSTSHGLSRSGPPDLRLHRLGEILAWWRKHFS